MSIDAGLVIGRHLSDAQCRGVQTTPAGAVPPRG